MLSTPLDHAPSSASTARARVVALVGPWASDDLCGELSLLVSELVANAVAHGLPEVHLDVRMDERSRIRVEVSDGSRALPELQPRTLERASGRGLQIVDAMASTWGAQLQPHGKVVWFELAATGCNATR